MVGGLTRKWTLDQAWKASAETAALAYGVEIETILAPSRGRGPRPPQATWDAKKIAVFLTVVVSDCDYAELGRHIGLHRDTVASHCAFVRDVMHQDADAVSLEALEALARGRLGQFDRQRIDALRASLAMIEHLTSGLPPSSDNHPTLHPTDFDAHETVIVDVGTARRLR